MGPVFGFEGVEPVTLPGTDPPVDRVLGYVHRLAAALRPALQTHGIPEVIYVDNGSAFVDASLARWCAPGLLESLLVRERLLRGFVVNTIVLGLDFCWRAVIELGMVMVIVVLMRVILSRAGS